MSSSRRNMSYDVCAGVCTSIAHLILGAGCVICQGILFKNFDGPVLVDFGVLSEFPALFVAFCTGGLFLLTGIFGLLTICRSKLMIGFYMAFSIISALGALGATGYYAYEMSLFFPFPSDCYGDFCVDFSMVTMIAVASLIEFAFDIVSSVYTGKALCGTSRSTTIVTPIEVPLATHPDHAVPVGMIAVTQATTVTPPPYNPGFVEGPSDEMKK